MKPEPKPILRFDTPDSVFIVEHGIPTKARSVPHGEDASAAVNEATSKAIARLPSKVPPPRSPATIVAPQHTWSPTATTSSTFQRGKLFPRS